MLAPPSEDDRYAELERRIRQLETALRLSFTTISGGSGIRIVDGGRLALVSADDVTQFYIGPVLPNQSDGSPQPGWIVRRADGSVVLHLRDAFPDQDGAGSNQALTWSDRSGNAVLADDTDSGQGIARPYVPGVFYLVRDGDWPATTSDAFEALYRAKMPKQQPRLRMAAWAGNSASGTTGEVRVMVNGAQLGPTVTISNDTIGEFVFGPAAVAGEHMAELIVELQARRTGGTGGIKACPSRMEGQQS